MPTNPSTFVDPNSIPNAPLPSYSVPNFLSTTGGPTTRTTHSPYSNILNVLDPSNAILPGFSQATGINLGSLFGFGGSSTKPAWNPYYDPSTGQYYANNPRTTNPIGLSNIPGAPVGEGQIFQNAANQTRIIQSMLPYLTSAVNQQNLPSAVSQLQASQATSPGYAQLMTNLYNQYGPALNQIGNTIQQQNALAQANTTNQVLNGPGQQAVQGALALQQQVDPQFFASRAATSGRLGDLLNSIDLSGKLSGSEQDEIEKSLARQGIQRGTQNAPSATDTVANAMTFGQAGYQRKQQAISNLSDAISKASAFLPSSRSGIDAFQVATGRSSQANPGQSNLGNNLFPGINNASNQNAFGLAGNLLGGTNSQLMNQAQITSQQKDWLDQFSQLSSGISSLVGSAGKVAGGFL